MRAKLTDCAASLTATITPVSCSGRNPLGTTRYSHPVPASVSANTTSTARCRRIAQSSDTRYHSSVASNPRSNRREIAPGRSTPFAFSRYAHIIGVTVRETTAETVTATDSVTANVLNSRPITPVMNSSGMTTAISETVSEMMVNPICADPS